MMAHPQGTKVLGYSMETTLHSLFTSSHLPMKCWFSSQLTAQTMQLGGLQSMESIRADVKIVSKWLKLGFCTGSNEKS